MELTLSLDGTWEALIDPNDLYFDSKAKSYSFPDNAEWTNIRVPGHWQEESKLRDYSGVLWYRKTFEYSAKEHKRIWLVFNGVFYRADVWLNGIYLGTHKGYFAPFLFEVTDIISESNILVVRVSSYDERDVNNKKQVGGVFYHWDCRDPSFNPGGIWSSVAIYETGEYAILEHKIVTRRVDRNRFLVHVRLLVSCKNDGEINIKLILKPKNFEADPEEYNFARHLKRGTNPVELEFFVDKPKLWWTWDLGFPHVYLLEISLLDGSYKSDKIWAHLGFRSVKLRRNKGWTLYLNGKRLFVRGTNYGPTDQHLSRVTIDKVKRDAELMRNANINMVRIHAHVNPLAWSVFDEYGILVWQDMPLQWMYSKSIENDAVNNSKELARMLLGHPSIAVVAAHNEPFRFSDKKDFSLVLLSIFLGLILAPSVGILPFILRLFGLELWFLDSIIRVLRAAYPLSIIFGLILASILFPTLALMLDPWYALIITLLIGSLMPLDFLGLTLLFMALFRTSPILYFWNWNRNVLDKKLSRILKNEGMGWFEVVEFSGGMGWLFDGTDTHLYFGWYVGWLLPYWGYRHIKVLKWPFQKVLRFVSEFGAQALPSLESLKKFVPSEVLDVVLEDFGRGYPELSRYLRTRQYQSTFMKLWVNPSRFSSLEDFIAATQDWQSRLLRYYIEKLRSLRFRPVGGILQFMFVDIAPLITWSVLDYWRKPKRAYFTLKEAYNPLYVFVDPDKPPKPGRRRLVVYIVNDYHRAFDGCSLSIYAGSEKIFEAKLNIGCDSMMKKYVELPRAIRDEDVVLELACDELVIKRKYRLS